jgi:mono/diheme cytochrome c family protein
MLTKYVSLVAALLAAPVWGADKIEYNRDIRPILAENCFACHGPDSASRKAKLRLDQHDAAVKAGAITPGKPQDSELVQRIFAEDVKERMPPAATKKVLTQAQKDLLKRWIAAGAVYQIQWSFLPPVRTPLPEVHNKAWVRNSIDRFILAKLEAHDLKPAPEADRRTLARRLSLDLTGLPPEPADVEAFVNDPAPDAYEKLVDKFMHSPAWGEHRARYWLDAARYADTHGLHFDNYREMWAYRDWVIDAYNRNLPFDQFGIEQLAGDLLPHPTLDQLVATGFNRCNMTTNEGGTILEENLVMYTRDRTETTAAVFLGLTANCAVCHDHKFDPISARDFYSLSAFFNNTTQGALDGNIRDTPPITFVPKREDRARWDKLAQDIKAMKATIEARKQAARPDFEHWLKTATPALAADLVPVKGLSLHAPLNEGTGQTLHLTVAGKSKEVKVDAGFAWVAGKIAPKAFGIKPGAAPALADVGDFERNQGFSIGTWIKLPKRGLNGAAAARMDNTSGHRGWDLWMENDRVAMHIINKWPENALKVTTKASLKPGEWHHVLVTYDGSSKARGVKIYFDGTPQPVDVFTDKLTQTIRTKVPFKIGQRHMGEGLPAGALQDLRVYERTLDSLQAEQLAKGTLVQATLVKAAPERTPSEITNVFGWWLSTMDAPARALNAGMSGLQLEEAAMRSRGTITFIVQERPQEPVAYVLYRGDYDKRRDKVGATTPKSLPPLPAKAPHNRLGFARWLFTPEQPLTARVTVNRFWQQIFGTGIVRTTGDFGVMGEQPSHPELLDWLAVDFRESGWDVRRFFKQIVTSAAYRQAATVSPDSLEKDPNDRLLSRGPRSRMDAEMMRDYALAASGLLVRKIGGPSVKPYQPDNIWDAVALIGSDTRDYKRDSGDKLYRRSMYTFWKRGAPPPSMDILNAPSREICTVHRDRTDTPLQALVTLNDPQFVEAARNLAQLTLKQGGDQPAARIDFLARRLLARPFRTEEASVVEASLRNLVKFYKAHAEEAGKLITVGESRPDPALNVVDLAAYTMLANQLFNLDEVLNK